MVKYLNILACSALAMFIASPASAGVINLYELKNFLYYGESNLGKGIKGEGGTYKYDCDDSKWILPSDHKDFSKMSGCKRKTYPGGTECYVGCECDKTRFPYTSDNCSGKYFETGGEVCEDLKGEYYASCSCSSNTIPVNDNLLLALQTVFNGVVQRSAGVNGEVVCNVIENPSCKDGYVQLSDLPSGTQIATGYSSYRRTIDSDRTPFSYELFGSNNRREPGTIYCINQTSIQDKFSGAVSFDASSLNQSCAKVLTGTDPISNKAFAYYSGDCIDGTAKLCSTKSVTCMAYSSVDVNFYKPDNNSLGARSCNFVSGCKVGVDSNGVMCDVATKTKTGIAYTNYTDQNQNCIKLTGCATGYTQKMFQSVPIEPDPMVYEIESDMYTYSYSKYLTNKDANNKFGFISCAVESGCRADKGYCVNTSTLLSSIKSASTLGYTLTSSSSCDGVKIKHPLEDKYICIHNGQ